MELIRRVCVASIVLAALLAGAAAVAANGVPVDIYLSYLPRESNWGPQSAQGKARVAVADGSISLDAVGLAHLEAEHYTIWLESRGEHKVYAVGQFSADEKGEAHFKADLDVPNQEYRMLFLSVETGAAGRLETKPNTRRAIAGMFPNKIVTPATAQAAPSVSGGTVRDPAPDQAAPVTPAPGQAVVGAPAVQQPLPRPPYLPVTGMRPYWLKARPSQAAFVAVLAVVVALTLAGAGDRGLGRSASLHRRRK